MMIFNPLFSAWAALAAPEQPVEEHADEVTAADDVSVDVTDDDVEFTDEVDPSEARRWRCFSRPRSHGFCLARCEDSNRFTRVTGRIRVRGNRNFCERRARQACRGRGGLDAVCFGDRT